MQQILGHQGSLSGVLSRRMWYGQTGPFLVWVQLVWKEKAVALTLNQVRLLLTSVLPRAVFDAERALFLVLYY